jgi:hypothetical protein
VFAFTYCNKAQQETQINKQLNDKVHGATRMPHMVLCVVVDYDGHAPWDALVADADLSGEGDCCDRERGAAGGGAQVGL